MIQLYNRKREQEAIESNAEGKLEVLYSAKVQVALLHVSATRVSATEISAALSRVLYPYEDFRMSEFLQHSVIDGRTSTRTI